MRHTVRSGNTRPYVCSRCGAGATRKVLGRNRDRYYCDSHSPETVDAASRLTPLMPEEKEHNRRCAAYEAGKQARESALSAIPEVGVSSGPVPASPHPIVGELAKVQALIDRAVRERDEAKRERDQLRTRCRNLEDGNLAAGKALAAAEEQNRRWSARCESLQQSLEAAMNELRDWRSLADQLTTPDTSVKLVK